MAWSFAVAAGCFIFGVFGGWISGRRRSDPGQRVEKALLVEKLTVAESKFSELRSAHESLVRESQSLRIREAELNVRVQEERRITEEKQRLLDEAEKKLTDSFKALSSEALRANNQSFLELARVTMEKFQEQSKGDLKFRQQAIEEMVRPIRESLDKVGLGVSELEKQRIGAYEGLKQQVQNLVETQTQLRTETANLSKALRSPHVRGRWGEIQLKRVVEMAGMVEYCDFQEQASVTTEDGRLRPDLLVRLPGRKHIVIDAKAPLSAYLESIEVGDEELRKQKIGEHARQIRQHIVSLSRKAYWDQFESSPEFVVMFLPGEIFFSAALEQDPSLIEAGVEHKVILATPTTLIALLRAVGYGWRQERLHENAQLISELGRELYKRLSDMGEHLSRVGRSLGQAVDSYNKAVGSMESRVLVTARKFKELDATALSDELNEILPIENTTRSMTAEEMRDC